MGTNEIRFEKIPKNGDYSEYLLKMKTELENIWDENKKSLDITLGDFKCLQILGIGGFGLVRLVRYEKDGQSYALKILSKKFVVKQKIVQNVISEKHIMNSIRFPFLLNLKFTFKDNDSLYFGMEFMQGGELFHHLRKRRKFTEDQTKFYAAQILLGLEYLHSADLIYRDLKPENIVLDDRGYLKIIDFGFCKKVPGRTYTFCGTIEYLAPEIILSKGYGKSVDWWAFGVLIYEMASGTSPFYAENDATVMENITQVKYQFPKFFSDNMKNLITNLLKSEVSFRYGNLKNGIYDIKDHKWFNSVNWIELFNQESKVPFIPTLKNSNIATYFPKQREPKKEPPSTECMYEFEFIDF